MVKPIVIDPTLLPVEICQTLFSYHMNTNVETSLYKAMFQHLCIHLMIVHNIRNYLLNEGTKEEMALCWYISTFVSTLYFCQK